MTSELTKALCAFQREVGTIHKESRAQYGSFADLATVLSTISQPLSKQGLAITQTFVGVSEGEGVKLVTTLHHTSGETLVSELPMIVQKGRHVLHDFGAACTYLRRYSLLAMLNLVADIDTDGVVEEAPAKPQVQQEVKPSGTKAKASPKPKPEAAKPSPEPKVSDLPAEQQPVSDADRNLCKALLTDLKVPPRNQLIAAFKKQFDLPADAIISAHITLPEHVRFIQQRVAEQPAEAFTGSEAAQ